VSKLLLCQNNNNNTQTQHYKHQSKHTHTEQHRYATAQTEAKHESINIRDSLSSIETLRKANSNADSVAMLEMTMNTNIEK